MNEQPRLYTLFALESMPSLPVDWVQGIHQRALKVTEFEGVANTDDPRCVTHMHRP